MFVKHVRISVSILGGQSQGWGDAELGHIDRSHEDRRLPLVDSQAAEQPQKPTDNPPGGDLGGDGPGTYIKQVTDGTHTGCQGEESGVPSGQRGGTSHASASLISSP